MTVTFWKGVFVADSAPGDRVTLERAGFELHEPSLCGGKIKCRACRAGVGRRWWSPRVESATRVRSSCNERALKMMRDHLERLRKSRAVDSDLEVPCPPGLEYKPYQRAGISYALQRKDTLIGDEMGVGKDQPLDAKLLTPHGWTRMGDIQLNDTVAGSDGHFYPVTGIFPQGRKSVYRVTFQDGSTCECGKTHLWEVNTPLRRWRRRPPQILPLEQIIKRRLVDRNGNHQHFVPLTNPVKLPEISHFIDPYLMGYLLGNGGTSQHSVNVCVPDQESVLRLTKLLPPGVRLKPVNSIDYRIISTQTRKLAFRNPVLNELRRLKLMGHHSYTKFIPSEYAWDSPSNRLSLLQGLIDADGHVRPLDGNIEYSSSSPQLAKDVQQLIWSLGGTALVRPKKTKCRLSYRMSVRLPNDLAPCRLKRKLKNRIKRTKYPPHRYMTKIEYVGRRKTQCISVDSPNNLYVTDDYVLTHNTISALGFVNKLGDAVRNVLVVGPATLSFNWKLEAEKWLLGKWRVFVPRSGSDAVPEQPADQKLLVITNYDKVVGKSKLTDSLARVWDVAVFDEAHALKNPRSQRSLAVLGERGLLQRAHRTLFLTGTPIENFPKEMWPLAAALCPAKFGDWWAFAKRYCGLHQEQRGDRVAWVATGGTHLAELQQRLRAAFMVRRLKADVLKELPPKRRQLVVLGDEEVDWSSHPDLKKWREVYEQAYEEALARGEASRTDAEYRVAVRQLEVVTGVAFQEMSEFRHETALAKLPACIKYLDEVLASTTDSVVVFAYHEDVLLRLRDHFGEACVLLYGKTPMKARGEAVLRFQAGEKRVFIGGLANKVACVGINLHRASIVVFCEIDWVPGTMSQAEDRLCRIGQTKMVHVIHLVLNQSLDANMSKRVIAKQDAIDKALDHLPEQLRLKQVK